MIIQCRKCETRFRFDEALITGDGVWVRCSRCQNVFFQQNPAGEALSAGSGEIPTVRISEARRMPDDRFAQPEERLPKVDRERTETPSFGDKLEMQGAEEFEKEPTLEGIEPEVEEMSQNGLLPAGEPEEEAADQEEEPADGETGQRRWGRTLLKIAAVTLFVILVAGGVALWVLPEVRQQALELSAPWLRVIPGAENLLGKEPLKGQDALAAPIRLKDVRQRSVANLLAGNLHVIEGLAVNQASYPVAKVRIRLVISDAYDVVLGERFSFCGNLLTDAELSTLAEAEIQRELTKPQGSDVPNARIAPKGEIPFQLVFSQEQAGAIKTVVMPAGAERIP